ncbi:hypothetical protein Pfo_015412 [Paulownia fortunei]|nr:hypothetical protein Pfo_015412 [Paulownia fortunei]
MILRSLKDHYLKVSKMTPPPKISPPSPYIVVKGAHDSGVMRMVDIVPGVSGDDNGDDSINRLFVHVDISKPGLQESLHFLCGLYPDALGIHSVSQRPKAESSGFLVVPNKYNGPVFDILDSKNMLCIHNYILTTKLNIISEL